MKQSKPLPPSDREAFERTVRRMLTTPPKPHQRCKEKHLHRYLAEFDFRYNTRSGLGFTDGERAALSIKNADGKRLTYRPLSGS